MTSSSDHCTVLAPAKINLGLRVLGRRPDGYHELETTFVAVDLYDRLTFHRGDAGGFKLTWENADPDAAFELETGENNLITRAARLVERECGLKLSLAAHLLKRIPIAAGLGGGSSDAAATLAALNRLYTLGRSREQLADWAAQLGSDVPFFLGEPCAFARGRGERLEPRSIPTAWWAVLACPAVPLTAGEVYAALDLTSTGVASHVSGRLDGEGFIAALGRITNDLEPVVIHRVPEVSYWRTQLLAMGAAGVYVSGSGPTVFGVFTAPPDMGRLEQDGPKRARLYVVRPVETPLALVIG
ncbi:MAG: 4-(cytidine 5'-diphospho)-2-C-methyl-D-erythritol kinase [Candidatus Zixiibacteriota bacterium]